VPRWPVAGPSGYWLLASSPATSMQDSTTHTVKQYTSQKYTQDNNSVHKRSATVAHRKINTRGRKYCTYFLILLLHRYCFEKSNKVKKEMQFCSFAYEHNFSVPEWDSNSMWTSARPIPFQFILTFYLTLYYCTSPLYNGRNKAFHISSIIWLRTSTHLHAF
jgi:hypothetical protein